ncbi:coenzyme F420-0:L-glutamate ligase [Pusillimonas sp.]|uniref:coenzyme F420-0:L-glutamate ligase n=1 Tax=Pusillimonas sp. TaxID=3040095 RepID=UPI0037C809F5
MHTPDTSIKLTALDGFPMVLPGDDLPAAIIDSLEQNGLSLESGDVVILAQKIVSKAEGRLVRLADVTPSPRAQEIARDIGKDERMIELILSESKSIVTQAPGVLIVEHRLGYIMANAGIDQSNIDHHDGDEYALLLPENPDQSCRQLKARLDSHFGATVGVLINDSFGRPWRLGVTGVALGAAGLPSLISLIGKPDLYGRSMRVSEIAYADEIAAAASLLMGQTDAGKPVVHLRGLRWDSPENSADALIRPRHQDLFR